MWTKAFYKTGRIFFILGLAVAWKVLPCMALEADEVLVMANQNVAEGIELARYYMEKRGMPGKNLIRLRVTRDESCSRKTYEAKIAKPLREYLRGRSDGEPIRCLVLMYGLPLKIKPSAEADGASDEIAALMCQAGALRGRINGDDPVGKEALKTALAQAEAEISRLRQQQDRRASLDSEIALVLGADYPLAGWVLNPHYIGFQNKAFPMRKEAVLLVSRLDGPSPDAVRRIIDDSLNAEARGLTGRAFFDARWPEPVDKKQLSAYRFYDNSIHQAGRRIEQARLMPVVTDASEGLFQSGQCHETALYCGWYSLARYVDAFEWRPGAVGYHIASSECMTLRKKGSQVWCKRMIEEGIAATVGPVSEPYVSAFPIPEIFFSLLIRGPLTLAECYMASIPYVSWKMVLIGDPLYRPFWYMGLKKGADPFSVTW